MAMLSAGTPNRDAARPTRISRTCAAAFLHRVAAGGVALVGRLRGVGGDESDARRSDDQLFRGELDQCGFDALSKLDLAGKDGDRSVRADANPRVEHGRVL